MVVAGNTHTVGLKSDSKVVVGRNDDSRCNLGFWRDIVQVAAGKMLLLDG